MNYTQYFIYTTAGVMYCYLCNISKENALAVCFSVSYPVLLLIYVFFSLNFVVQFISMWAV